MKKKGFIIVIVLIVLGLGLMIYGEIGLIKREKVQLRRIEMLEQSLNEQIQEKNVYMKMLEESEK
mgnify:CR=1 FL=1